MFLLNAFICGNYIKNKYHQVQMINMFSGIEHTISEDQFLFVCIKNQYKLEGEVTGEIIIDKWDDFDAASVRSAFGCGLRRNLELNNYKIRYMPTIISSGLKYKINGRLHHIEDLDKYTETYYDYPYREYPNTQFLNCERAYNNITKRIPINNEDADGIEFLMCPYSKKFIKQYLTGRCKKSTYSILCAKGPNGNRITI